MKCIVPVPIVDILLWATELIPKAHTNNMGHAVKHGSHSSEPLDPFLRVEILIPEEPISVEVAAAPPWLADVIVQYHHQLRLPQPPHHRLQSNFKIKPIIHQIQTFTEHPIYDLPQKPL